MPSAKNKRDHRFTNGKAKSVTNLKKQIRKFTKRLERGLSLYATGKLISFSKKIKDEENQKVREVQRTRRVGIKPDGGKHRRLVAHLETLNRLLSQVKHAVDTNKKK